MLSLILPTYNEAANIGNLLEMLDGVLASTPHEIIVVDDDSPDKTWKVATECSKLRGCIKVLRRMNKTGLSSAVVDGFDAAHGDILAVMDSDGQHDGQLLLSLVERIKQGFGLAIGSRYVVGGSVGSWVRDRRIISSTGTFFAKRLSQVPVSDPLGGFFVLRRDLYRSIRSKLHPTGFKILLEILAAVPENTRVAEVPLIFRMRLHGESKLSLGVHLAFVLQIVRLWFCSFARRLRGSGAVVFAAMMVAAALVIIPHLFALRLLYVDSDVRHRVQEAMMTVADREGWLVSDIAVRSVSSDSLSIVHREHLRTRTFPRFCTIDLHTVTLSCPE